MANVTPKQRQLSERFPWTKPYLEVQAAHWEQLVTAMRAHWSDVLVPEVVQSVTIRGFESEARCKELLRRQAVALQLAGVEHSDRCKELLLS